MFGIGRGRFTERVVIEREAALQPARDLRICFLPTPPFGKRPKRRQSVSSSQVLQKYVGQRRGGFADGKARVLAFLQQNHGASQLVRDHGQEATTKARSNHRDVVGFVQFEQLRFLAATQFLQCTSGMSISLCARFMRCRRPIRAGKQSGHAESFLASHRSANTRPRLVMSP